MGKKLRTWTYALYALALAVAVVAPVCAHEGHAPVAGAAPAKPVRAELGASVAVAPDGSWQAVAVRSGHVVLYRSDDDGRSWSEVGTVNRTPEAISADGENRPKIVFAPDGAVLVSWARRFEERFTGDVRFARAADGRHFDEPVTVHRDRSITGHSFNAMLMTSSGRLVLAWIDGRERKAAEVLGEDYRGSAIFAAVSGDGGRSFADERKVADHACQCCRLALVEDGDGAPLLLWRHVFDPNVRDHAITRLGADGAPVAPIERATFDGWQIDACPHHGPSLALAADGTRHAVWFNQRDGEGRVFYGRLAQGAVVGQRPVGGPRAAHADIAVAGPRVAIVWKEFDGERTALLAELSEDCGRHFTRQALAVTDGASDQPRLLRRGDALFAFWHTENEGMKGYRLP